MHRVKSVLVCVLLWTISAGLSLAFDPGTECIPLQDCPYLMRLIEIDKYDPLTLQILRKSDCGRSKEKGPLTLCPKTISCTTSDGNKGICTPINDCQESLPVQNLRSGMAEDICNSLIKAERYICCATPGVEEEVDINNQTRSDNSLVRSSTKEKSESVPDGFSLGQANLSKQNISLQEVSEEVVVSKESNETCIPLIECRFAMDLISKDIYNPITLEFLRNSDCGRSQDKRQMIWCPNMDSCQTPDGQEGTCTLMTECQHLLAKISVSTQLKGFRCNGRMTSLMYICCPRLPVTEKSVLKETDLLNNKHKLPIEENKNLSSLSQNQRPESAANGLKRPPGVSQHPSSGFAIKPPSQSSVEISEQSSQSIPGFNLQPPPGFIVQPPPSSTSKSIGGFDPQPRPASVPQTATSFATKEPDNSRFSRMSPTLTKGETTKESAQNTGSLPAPELPLKWQNVNCKLKKHQNEFKIVCSQDEIDKAVKEVNEQFMNPEKEQKTRKRRYIDFNTDNYGYYNTYNEKENLRSLPNRGRRRNYARSRQDNWSAYSNQPSRTANTHAGYYDRTDNRNNLNADVYLLQPSDYPESHRPDTRSNFPTTCGRTTRSYSQRIIGGYTAAFGEYPWMALIQYRATNRIANGCGATLITARFVLTAAHCVDDSILNLRKLKLHRIVLGEYDTTKNPDCIRTPKKICADPIQIYKPAKIIKYDDFDNVHALHDIALIQLDRKVEFSNYIKPICLPRKEFLDRYPAGVEVIVAGWGRVATRGNYSAKLTKATLPLVDKDACNTRGVQLIEGQMCLGLGNGIDTCTGDSGGPMIMQKWENWELITYQIGIISYGFATEACGSAPSVNTYLPYYLDWIYSIID